MKVSRSAAGFRRAVVAVIGVCSMSALVVSCGGGGSVGNERDSGVNKTYLSVDVSDADGDALQYQWRVTGGTIDNRNAKETVWTMPDGPGLHFAYVAVSDGKGGWVEQQYAVASDNLDTDAPHPAPITRSAPAVVEVPGAQARLRFSSADPTRFQPLSGGATQARTVFLPDVTVQVTDSGTGAMVFAGRTDLRGELDLPKLQNGATYDVRCATQPDAAMVSCGTIAGGTLATVQSVSPTLPATQNLRLFGHVALADGAVCGNDNAFFSIQSAADVQVRLADGTAIGKPVHVNRYGDYQVDAAVPVNGPLKLDVRCEGYLASLDVPASPGGYTSGTPVELSHAIANHRPVVVKMVANGADGNVRGRMIVPGQGTGSASQPGSDHFLIYKGKDTRLSACLYYRALGAVADCDAQGTMIDPISFDDWKRKNGFGTSADVSANYINKRDLNLVRRMVANRAPSGDIAFYVCNAPGPDGRTQEEVDRVMEDGLNNQKKVACVAMEFSAVTGANGNDRFTKFFTFGPTGALLASINLDGRGEKFVPGSCVACHGGATYNGRFPEQSTASPYLGSRFLPFDTGNYFFGSAPSLTEAAQSEAFFQLNQLVAATEPSPTSSTSNLIQGWYAAGHTLDKGYVPPDWRTAEAAVPGAATLYHEVIGTACRTCHASLGANFDWDKTVLSKTPIAGVTTKDPSLQFCGGRADLASNASMPQALISSDLLQERVSGDAALASLMTQFLGCSAPAPDPVYPKR